MKFTNKVKKDIERKRLDKVVFECIASVVSGNQGMFEHQDRTGCYCFIPSTFYCPLKLYLEDVRIDPAFCRAQLLRDELFSDPISANYLKGRKGK